MLTKFPFNIAIGLILLSIYLCRATVLLDKYGYWYTGNIINSVEFGEFILTKRLFVDRNGNITCANVRCGDHEVCVECPNACNLYSCFNPDGSTVKCAFMCKAGSCPKCMCKPCYHRLCDNGPCVPLIWSCPSDSWAAKRCGPKHC